MKLPLPIPHGIEDRWKQTRSGSDAYLLRLAILRDLIHKVHAEKSEAMARHETKETISKFSALELHLEDLREHSGLEGALTEILASKPANFARPRHLPPPLIKILGPDKLDRLDRIWEASIASEACRLGWEVWALDASLPLSQVEEKNAELEKALWPKGIVLFVEASPVLKSKSADTWGGRWVSVLRPGTDATKFFPGGKWTKVFSLTSQ